MKNFNKVILKYFLLSLLFSITIILITLSLIPLKSNKAAAFIPNIPADDWFEKQRAFPFSEIPAGVHEKALQQVESMPVMESGFAAWTLAGPTNIEGRITTIAIHPSNPQIVFAGTANGGLWKSTDFCQSWVSVFDNQNTSSIGAVAIDPLNPNNIYCGTGEANSLRSYYPGTGLYKSTNGGTTWVLSGLQNTYSIGNISINPSNPQILYAAALGSLRRKNIERGLYKSVNGGTSWTQVLYHSDSVGAVDVAVDPQNPSRVFAGMWERFRREDNIKYGGPMTALYLSTNSGTSWNIVAGGFPSNDPTLGRIALDICASNSQIIYALTAYANGNSRGLYKSTDAGASWTLINSGVAASSNYAWFNRICRVSPSNANNVFCGGLNMQVSSNGGTSFSTVSASHVDQHAAAFAPSNTAFVVIGNDGGIDFSTNGGSSWQYSTSLPVTQFYAGEISYQNPNTILGGTQDNGTNRTTGSISAWQQIYGGDGFYCLVDYNDPQKVYASSQNGGLVRSINGGSSFTGATSGLDRSYTNWMTPYVMDKNNPSVLYCGTYKIHKTTNGMQSWTVISPDLSNGHVQNLGTITTVDVSKSNPQVIYCGTDDANVWVTTNGGTSWTKIINGLPYRWVTRVTVHNDSANVCYVTLSGYKVDSLGAHIFRTSNYGINWQSITGNLPDAPVNDIILGYNEGTLYAATDVGVMATTNYGSNWFVLETGIPSSVPCHDLTLHTPSGKLVVWTHGRSAYSTTIPVGIISSNGIVKEFRLYQNYPNPFNPVTKIKFDISGRGIQNVNLIVFDILGREIKTIINSKLLPGSYEVNFDASRYSSGIYFYRLSSGENSITRSMMFIK